MSTPCIKLTTGATIAGWLLGGLLLTQAGHAKTAQVDQQAWETLLQQHVKMQRGGRASRVDYAGMARDKTRLTNYLTSISAVTQHQFDQWSKDKQLAFLINAYNAWTVDLVLSKYPHLDSIKDVGGWLHSPWKKSFIPLLGKTRSLDDIEQHLIRGANRYNEPRVHFALNCASIGCPALQNHAYQATRLNAQLNTATQHFLKDRQRNHMDGHTLTVSPIFKWYKKDFGQGWHGDRNVSMFLAHYSGSLGLTRSQKAALKAGKMPLDYSDYNWQLNDNR